MKMPDTPNVKTQYFSNKKETPDLLKEFKHDELYTDNTESIMNLGFEPIFTYLDQFGENSRQENGIQPDEIDVLFVLITNARRNIEQYFTDLDKHLGDPWIIRRKFGNWEHPEHEVIGVELIQRTPKAGKSLADLIPLVEAARKRGHDVDAVLRDLVEKDPEEVPT